jgi:hypothetical protein
MERTRRWRQRCEKKDHKETAALCGRLQHFEPVVRSRNPFTQLSNKTQRFLSSSPQSIYIIYIYIYIERTHTHARARGRGGNRETNERHHPERPPNPPFVVAAVLPTHACSHRHRRRRTRVPSKHIPANQQSNKAGGQRIVAAALRLCMYRAAAGCLPAAVHVAVVLLTHSQTQTLASFYARNNQASKQANAGTRNNNTRCARFFGRPIALRPSRARIETRRLL